VELTRASGEVAKVVVGGKEEEEEDEEEEEADARMEGAPRCT